MLAVSRFRSSQVFVARSYANFGIKRDTSKFMILVRFFGFEVPIRVFGLVRGISNPPHEWKEASMRAERLDRDPINPQRRTVIVAGGALVLGAAFRPLRAAALSAPATSAARSAGSGSRPVTRCYFRRAIPTS